MKEIEIKPTVAGTIIRDPETKRPLPDEGKLVKWSSYWERRKIEGCIDFCKKVNSEASEQE